MIKIVALSDSHNQHNKIKIPECDLLIHAGDATGLGSEGEVKNFARWFEEQPAKHKVFVPGNHEKDFEDCLPFSKLWFTEWCPSAHLLINEGVEIEGIKIWGSPITPYFHDWAWNKKSWEIKPYWDAIPSDTNLLITHGPPYEICDELLFPDGVGTGTYLGCWRLRDRVKEIKPDIHIFGHIHCGHGQKHIDGTSYYNVALLDEMYIPTNPVTIIEY